MNYQTIYHSLITRAISEDRSKSLGMERHHILPRSLGGSNDPANLVYLTAREHFVAHKLLVKIYKNQPLSYKKMVYALWQMSMQKDRRYIGLVTSTTYERARAEFSKHNPNKDPQRQQRYRERRAAGFYKIDNKKAGRHLSASLRQKSPEELLTRMQNSALKCDHAKRGAAIKKGKGSLLQMIRLDGQITEFWSFDNVVSITGMTYSQLRYRIKAHNGLLNDGSRVVYVQQYDTKHSQKLRSKLRYEKFNGEIFEFSPTDAIETLTGYSYNQIRNRLIRHNGIMSDGSKVYWLQKYNHRNTNGRDSNSC